MVNSFALAGLLAAPLLANAAVVPRERTLVNGIDIKSYKPPATRKPSELAVTSLYAPLKRSGSGQSHSKAIMFMRASSNDVPYARLNGSDGVDYFVTVKWADQSFSVILDTGSADIWVISNKFKCINADEKKQPAKTCGFGPGYKGTINQKPGTLLDVGYADGTFVRGEIGTVSMSMGGLVVPQQTVGLGTSANWFGGGYVSGVVGLAYPYLTSAFDVNGQRHSYDPFFTSAYKMNLTDSMFALALMGEVLGGYISFGGLPPLKGVSRTFATTDIEVLQGSIRNSSVRSYYMITPDAFVCAKSKVANKNQYMIDSGTTLNFLPHAIAKRINEAYEPAATLDPQYHLYTVDCSATPPKFGVTVDGITLYAHARDMIMFKDDPSGHVNGKCVTAIQNSVSLGVSILGEAWLKSVLAVFDVGASKMHFATHNY